MMFMKKILVNGIILILFFSCSSSKTKQQYCLFVSFPGDLKKYTFISVIDQTGKKIGNVEMTNFKDSVSLFKLCFNKKLPVRSKAIFEIVDLVNSGMIVIKMSEVDMYYLPNDTLVGVLKVPKIDVDTSKKMVDSMLNKVDPKVRSILSLDKVK